MHNVIFYYGAMKCGKTLLALSLAHQFQSQNKRVLVLKPAADTREGESLTSRAGLSISARIFETVTVDECMQADVIIIDEVQFLDEDAIDMLFKISMRHNIKGLYVLDYLQILKDGNVSCVQKIGRVKRYLNSNSNRR